MTFDLLYIKKNNTFSFIEHILFNLLRCLRKKLENIVVSEKVVFILLHETGQS